MTDQEVRTILAAALPGPPPSPGISREAAIAAGRRAARNRARTRTVSVAAVCMATVAVMAVPWFLGASGFAGLGFGNPNPSDRASGPVVSASDSVAPSTPASVGPPPTVPAPNLPGMTPSAATAELSRVLAAEARRILPDAQFGPSVVAFETGSRLLAPFDVVDNGHGYYIGLASISNGSVRGQFGISIWPAADDRKSPNPGCDSAYYPRLGCEIRTGPNGEQITIDMGRLEDATTVEYRVKVHRPQGAILMATVTNASGEGFGYPTPPPAQSPTPPMTADQLVDLLLTPGLVLR